MGKKSRRRREGQQSEEQSAPPPVVQHEEQPELFPEVQHEEESAPSSREEERVSHPDVQQEEESSSLARKKADDLIDRFQRATTCFPDDPWHPERAECLFLYERLTSSHLLRRRFVTKKDRKFLRKLHRAKESQPAFFMATALILYSHICQTDGMYRYQAAVDYADRAIAICDSASVEEKERILNIREPHGRVRVRDYLLGLREKSRLPERLCRDAFWQKSTPYNTGGDPTKPVFVFPGIQCDGCREHRCDLGLSTLKVCTSCKKVYYCSKRCQRKAWYGGHRHMCRKRGEFKRGDVAFILERAQMVVGDVQSGNFEDGVVCGNFSVGRRVRIVGPLPDDMSKLIVQDPDVTNPDIFGVVAVGNLQRCEPPRWCLVEFGTAQVAAPAEPWATELEQID